jgi:hypothetical protein
MVENQMSLALTSRGREMALLISEQERSGLSVREFAERRGVRTSTLNWWRWNLRRRSVGVSSESSVRGAMIPVTVVNDREERASPGSTILVRLPDGLEIEVSSGFDGGEIKRLIEALRC